MVNFGYFLKIEAFSQTVLPDKSILNVDKNSWKMPKWSIWRVFKNLIMSQKVIPDRTLLRRQKLIKNAKIKNFK